MADPMSDVVYERCRQGMMGILSRQIEIEDGDLWTQSAWGSLNISIWKHSPVYSCTCGIAQVSSMCLLHFI